MALGTVETAEIRPYGPGKFNTILDEYVWQVSLDGGPDDSIGESETFGWYGLMRHGHTIFRDHDPELEPLNDTERDFLLNCAGCIIQEGSQGFVDIAYFDTQDELDAEWAEILADYDKFADGEEG